jgi:hypothetical protein
MFNKIKEASIVDIQINMTAILAYIMWFALIVMFLLPIRFYKFLSISTGLFIANWPLLPFFIEVKLDKGWILSVIGVEIDSVISKARKGLLRNSKFLLYESAAVFLIILSYTGMSLENALSFTAIVLWIYFTLCMITQLMGFYVYWIARINEDPALKVNVPDIVILEQTLKTARYNYRGAWFFIVLLFMSLMVYLFAEYITPVASAIRVIFTFYALMLFIMIVLFLILGQLFDKYVVLLYISRSGYFNDLCAVVGNSMQKRLFLMKHFLALFLLMEVIVLPVILETFL